MFRKVAQLEFICEWLREGPEEGVRLSEEVTGHGDSLRPPFSSGAQDGRTTDVEDEEVEGETLAVD